MHHCICKGLPTKDATSYLKKRLYEIKLLKELNLKKFWILLFTLINYLTGNTSFVTHQGSVYDN